MRVETDAYGMVCDADWQEAFERFADGFAVEDVDLVLGSSDGENDGNAWVAVMVLKDGRFAGIAAGCDYTGWD